MIFSKKKVILILICLLFLITLLIISSSLDNKKAKVIFKTNNEDISFICWIADDAQSHTKGLLAHTTLESNKGMIFLYPSAKQRIFTMKEMKFPLDIIFINENKTVIHIVEANINDENINSNGPAQYVVEINQGLSKIYGIDNGTRVEILYDNREL